MKFTKAIFFNLFFVAMAFTAWSQETEQYICRNGEIHFFSSAPLEDIEATSKKAVAVLNPTANKVVVKIPNSSFSFKSKLMEEHFNENYRESHRFPNANFKGSIQGWNDQMLQKSGPQKIRFVGTLEIHGVARDINEAGLLEFNNVQIHLEINFKVIVAEYGIKVPALVRDKVAKEAEVHVQGNLKTSAQ